MTAHIFGRMDADDQRDDADSIVGEAQIGHAAFVDVYSLSNRGPVHSAMIPDEVKRLAVPVQERVAVPGPRTARLELKPLLARPAAALTNDRELACAILEAVVPPGWPDPRFLDVIQARATASSGGDHFGIWVVIDRASTTVVGDVGFKGPPDTAGTVEIGYSIIPDWQGRGYAAEGASALAEWALSRTRVRAVIASCDEGNAPSVRTLERVGFHRTGMADGEIRWRYTGVSSPVAAVPVTA